MANLGLHVAPPLLENRRVSESDILDYVFHSTEIRDKAHLNYTQLLFTWHFFVQLGPSFQMNCYAPSNLNIKSLFSNHENQRVSSIQVREGNNPSRTVLGFARLPDRTRNVRRLHARSCLPNGNGGFRQESHGITNKDGVIIVDHGSRRKESNLMLNEFVAMFIEKTGYPIVEPAHMELAEPSIQDAFRSCVQQGANRVIVSPFFLFPGRHWNQDIPSLTAEAAKDYPGVSYMITAPLGLHTLLVDVLDDRIKHCLSHVAGDADECAVCAGTGKCHLY